VDLFRTDIEMLVALDDFYFKSKGLNSTLRNEIIQKIDEFLENNDLDTDQHNFVNYNKYKRRVAYLKRDTT
jgi:hypothetical protein